jgi:hypothetical protein
MREQAQQLGEKERELTEKIEKNDRLERQLGRINQQLEENERVITEFQRQISGLEQLKPATDTSSSSKEQRISIKLTWREGEKAPHEMSGSYYAAVDGSALYVRQEDTHHMFCYTISTSSWSQLPDTPTINCPTVVIKSLLTLVGGSISGKIFSEAYFSCTNQLFSLTGEGSGRRWTKKFPPMPTKRYGTIALCTEAALIAAGGVNGTFLVEILPTVEVMNTETLQWSTAAALPHALAYAPASICGDQVYIMLMKSSMYTCSVQALVQSSFNKSFLTSFRNRGARVWKEATAPPVTETTCVSIHGRLLAIGGGDADGKPTSAVRMYNPTTDSWEVISHMGTPRWKCIAAVLHNNKVMVVGGYTGTSEETMIDSVEFAFID